MAPTRNDVARAAGVSSATVSRAYNAPERVDSDKVRRIMASARKLGYVPDKSASALRRNGSGTVLFCQRRSSDHNDTAERLYRWLYADALGGVIRAVDDSMLSLTIGVYRDARELADILKRRRADCVICHGAPTQSELKALRKSRIPFAVCRQMPPEQDSYNVSFVDEFAGGAAAGAALRASGCVKPCHITGNMSVVPVCRARWEGFASAFAPLKPMLIDGELGIDGGSRSALKAAETVRSGAVDGIFVVNDLTAVGVVQTLTSLGLRIPADVSLISYDNLPILDTLPVKLATMDIDFERVYREATQLLIESLRTGHCFRNAVVPTLIKGDSLKRQAG